MSSTRAVIVGCILCVVLASLTEAQNLQKMLDSLKETTGSKTESDSGSAVVQGLKEALRVGTEKAVLRTGTTDGYFGNARIKIGMPAKFQSAEKGLRLAGFGSQVDAFVLSMNRAAEQAAPQAQKIFLQAITSMSFADARKLLNGGDTAATDFFQAKTREELYASFRPVVDNSLNQVGTVQKYNAMVNKLENIPFMKSQTLDVGDYVTGKALDGLFVVVAEEERSIRQNPAARVTPLLKQVFGQ